jgi:hypothetical protein
MPRPEGAPVAPPAPQQRPAPRPVAFDHEDDALDVPDFLK